MSPFTWRRATMGYSKRSKPDVPSQIHAERHTVAHHSHLVRDSILFISLLVFQAMNIDTVVIAHQRVCVVCGWRKAVEEDLIIYLCLFMWWLFPTSHVLLCLNRPQSYSSSNFTQYRLPTPDLYTIGVSPSLSSSICCCGKLNLWSYSFMLMLYWKSMFWYKICKTSKSTSRFIHQICFEMQTNGSLFGKLYQVLHK